MHVPDGFFDTQTTIATDAAATLALGGALFLSRRELGEHTPPLAGLLAAFLFAIQLLSVPLGFGTSVHLLGGVLAAILVGPATAIACAGVVLIVHSVVMGFGGVTGMGASMIVMYLVPIAVGYAAYRALLTVLPRRTTSVTGAAAAATLLSALAGASAFTALVAIGATGETPLAAVAGVTIGAHLVSGALEAVACAAVVGTVLRRRPDLVRGATAAMASTPTAKRFTPEVAS